MTKNEPDIFRYYFSPDGDDATGDGTAAAPFLTFARTADEVAKKHLGDAESALVPRGYDRIEVAAIAETRPPGGGLESPGKCRWEYFVDPLGSEESGDGSDEAPWPDVKTAVARITELHAGGGAPIAPGQTLRLTVREVFTTTQGERRRRRGDMLAKYAFMVMAILLVLPLVSILSFLFIKAWPALSWSFITENPRDSMLAGGIWAPLVGTFYLVFLSLLVAAPIGILAGVYLNEYARDNWFTRTVNLAVVNLAGVPSIVHALFGVGAFVAAANMGYSVMAASCTLGIMTLPVIITSTREALASVPMSFREACWNMGATRWQTIRTIVLPNSISGILTGVILQVSRAAGETAPILFTGAVFYLPVADSGLASWFPYGLWDSCMALSYHLYAVMSQVKGVDGQPEVLEGIRYGTAVVLIGLVLTVNSFSIALRVYLRSRKKW